MKPKEVNGVPCSMARSGGDALNLRDLRRTFMHGKHLVADDKDFGSDQLQLDKADVQKHDKFEKYEIGDMSWTDSVPPCPVFHPTLQEFEDPLAYIHSIAPLASTYGICKIVSPLIPGRSAGAVLMKEKGGFKFTPRVQPLRLANWDSKDKMTFLMSGRQYSFHEYEKMANKFYVRKFSSAAILPPKYVEEVFWQEIASGKATSIEYGCDIEGSAFSTSATDPLGRSKWNLKDLSRLPNSTLRLLEAAIPGVTDPMLYIGMLFSMFAWHVEDHYLYSINYHHCGASKTWYGVPGHASPEFEKVVREQVYDEDMLSEHGDGAAYDLLIGKTTMFPPNILCKNGVPVYRAVQAPGEFVITFPRAYHSGFSHGFNCGEAVNFAMVDWFPFGAAACQRYELLNRMPLLPHEELLCKEAMHIAGKICEPCTDDARVSGSRVESENESQIAHPNDRDLENCVRISFVQLMNFQHKVRWLLKQRGASTFISPGYVSSVYCSLCKHMCYVAFLTCQCFTDPICLNHAKENRNCKCGSARTVVLSCNVAEMQTVGRKFERTAGILQGVTESNLKNDTSFKTSAREENLLNGADYSLYVPLSEMDDVPGTPLICGGDIESSECSKAPTSRHLSSQSLLGVKSSGGAIRKPLDDKAYFHETFTESEARIPGTSTSPSKPGALDIVKGKLTRSSQIKRCGIAIRSMPTKIPSTMSSAQALKELSKRNVSSAIIEGVDDNSIHRAKRQCMTLDTARSKRTVVDSREAKSGSENMARKASKAKESFKIGVSSKGNFPHLAAAKDSFQDVAHILKFHVSSTKILSGGNVSKYGKSVQAAVENQQMQLDSVEVRLSPKESSNDIEEHRLQNKRKHTALKETSSTEDATVTHAMTKYSDERSSKQRKECQSNRMNELLEVARLRVAKAGRNQAVKRQKTALGNVDPDDERAESTSKGVYSTVADLEGNKGRYPKKSKFEAEGGGQASCQKQNGNGKAKKQSSDPLVSTGSAQSGKISIKPPTSDKTKPGSVNQAVGNFSHKGEAPKHRSLATNGRLTIKASMLEAEGPKHIVSANNHVSDSKVQQEQNPVKQVSRLKIKGPSLHNVQQDRDMNKKELAQGLENINSLTGVIRGSLNEGSGESTGLSKRQHSPEPVANVSENSSAHDPKCNKKDCSVFGKIGIAEQKSGFLGHRDVVRSLKSIYNSTATFRSSSNDQKVALHQPADTNDSVMLNNTKSSRNIEASDACEKFVPMEVQTSAEGKAESHLGNLCKDMESIDKEIKQSEVTGSKDACIQCPLPTGKIQCLPFEKIWSPSNESRQGLHQVADNCVSDTGEFTESAQHLDQQRTAGITTSPVSKVSNSARHSTETREQVAIDLIKEKFSEINGTYRHKTTRLTDAGNGFYSHPLCAESGSSDRMHRATIKYEGFCNNNRVSSGENFQPKSLDTFKYKRCLTNGLNETTWKMVKEKTESLNSVFTQGQGPYTSHLLQSCARPGSISESGGNWENRYAYKDLGDFTGYAQRTHVPFGWQPVTELGPSAQGQPQNPSTKVNADNGFQSMQDFNPKILNEGHSEGQLNLVTHPRRTSIHHRDSQFEVETREHYYKGAVQTPHDQFLVTRMTEPTIPNAYRGSMHSHEANRSTSNLNNLDSGQCWQQPNYHVRAEATSFYAEDHLDAMPPQV
ncbi:hypothetical protein O6H91_17G057600 [Diphasiastrum complanatum]|uniref:Uncharacterized protein n=2 Tax=Diphasiastrum complanatum TaxID=34168 RepID=A0ACC2B763_DIPCM|nr:hypothetical protein O6H91_17G057600 [Diphasiastrum complanatum]KAJ7525585.1 hypothetical protein O6H91_17G057600 [Diphasiastrum complanatum]